MKSLPEKLPYLFHLLVKQVKKVWIWKMQLKEKSFQFHWKEDHDGYSRSEEEDREDHDGCNNMDIWWRNLVMKLILSHKGLHWVTQFTFCHLLVLVDDAKSISSPNMLRK